MISEWFICTKTSSDDILSVDTTTSIYLRHFCTYISSKRPCYPYHTRFIVRVCPLQRDLTADARQAGMRENSSHAFPIFDAMNLLSWHLASLTDSLMRIWQRIK